MVTGIFHAGVCGFTINVKVVNDESQSTSRQSKMIKLEIISDCLNYYKFLAFHKWQVLTPKG